MKVKITHTLELEEVPKKIKNLVLPNRQKFDKCIAHLESFRFLLSQVPTDEDFVLANLHIESVRRTLMDIDETLNEAGSMLGGVIDYKKSLEPEPQLPEQVNVATATPTPEDAKPAEPPRRRWNPHTRMLEDIDDD